METNDEYTGGTSGQPDILVGKMAEFASFVFSEDTKPGDVIPLYIQEQGTTPILIHQADHELQTQFGQALFSKGLQILWGIDSESDLKYETIEKHHLVQMNKHLKCVGVKVQLVRTWTEDLETSKKELAKAEVLFHFEPIVIPPMY